MKVDKNVWIWIACIAAAVAAITTVVVFVLRARQKAAAISEPVYECDCYDCTDDASAAKETVTE